MEYIRTVLGGNLRRLRSRRELSQTELANEANISMNFLSEIERGLKWPYPKTLQSLAEALGVEVLDFFRPIDDEAVFTIENYINRFTKDAALAVERSVKSALFNIEREYRSNSRI
jgi:transcriptional regulator with XRE-family HTH domain